MHQRGLGEFDGERVAGLGRRGRLIECPVIAVESEHGFQQVAGAGGGTDDGVVDGRAYFDAVLDGADDGEA